MDLNDIKRKAQKTGAPQTASGVPVPASCSLDDLTARLREADARERGGLRKAAPLFAIAAAVFFFVFVVTTWLPPEPASPGEMVLRVVLFALFLLLAVWSVRGARGLGRIDYAAPVRQFLELAEYRYRFLRPQDYLWIAIGCPLVVITTGVYVIDVMMDRYFGLEHRTLLIVVYGVFFVGVCVMGFVFTYLNWKRDKRTLWIEIKEMQAELDTEEPVQPETSSVFESSRS